MKKENAPKKILKNPSSVPMSSKKKVKKFQIFFHPLLSALVSSFMISSLDMGTFLNNWKLGTKLGQSETKYETGEDFTYNFSRKIFEILNLKSTCPLFQIWVFISYENLVIFVINTFLKIRLINILF
jgi:hypothetical protein